MRDKRLLETLIEPRQSMLTTGYGHINGIIESSLKYSDDSYTMMVFFRPYSKRQWILESRFSCWEFWEGCFSSRVHSMTSIDGVHGVLLVGRQDRKLFWNCARGYVLIRISWRKCTRSRIIWLFGRISINTNTFLLNGIGAIQH